MVEKILLINPEYRSREIAYFPLGLGYVASACNKEDIRVEFIDMNIGTNNFQRLINTIKENDIYAVGIGGFITQLKSTLELTSLIKEKCNDVTVIIGGIQVVGCEQFIFDNSAADIVCIGESEIALPQIVHAIYGGKKYFQIPSIMFKENGKLIKTEGISTVTNLDDLEFPLYEIFPMEYYIKGNYHSVPGSRTIDLICSRGCPYSCNYCINSKKSVKMRYRSPENIIKEIRLLKEKYSINDFSFGDEIFTVNIKKSLEICEAIKSEKITWVTSVRADGINDNILMAMKESGCRMLLIGFESGSEKILKSMDKKSDINSYSGSIRLLRKHNMMFYSNFMIGMPEESEKTIEETEKFCKENNLIFGGSYVTPFPGTKLYDDIRNRITDDKRYLLSLGELNFSKAPIINLTNMPIKRLIYLRNRTVVNTISHIIKSKIKYVPLFIIKFLGYGYLYIFDIKIPIISRISRSLAKALYKLFSNKLSAIL